MDRLQSDRRGFGPGRSLYNDDFYDAQNLYFDGSEDERIWDLEAMHVQHSEGQTLVGDDLVRTNHSGKGPKGYTKSDRLIHEEVCEALTQDPYIDASDIDVTVDKGTVFLRGEIADRQMKRETEDCVLKVPWVVDVMNELKVRPGR